MVRRKIVIACNGKSKPESPDDYVVYVTTKIVAGRHFGKLEIVRRTDGKQIYPFDGAPEIGPFISVAEAREMAASLGYTVVCADLRNPE